MEPAPPLEPFAQSVAAHSPVLAALILPQTLSAGQKLQDLIDAAAPGATLTLARDEYEGPVTIRKSLVLEGRESALWAKAGPVVTIAAPGVSLGNLDIEVTVSPDAGGEEAVALKVEKEAPQLQLDNVRVRGRISGLGDEDGSWVLPSSLDLGEFAARAENEFHFSLSVPTAVRLSSPVEGVSLFPAEVGAGEHQITLTVRDVAPETLLIGNVEVRSASLARTVPLRGCAVSGKASKLAQQL